MPEKLKWNHFLDNITENSYAEAKSADHFVGSENGRMIQIAFLNKLNAFKDKSMEKGKAHWEENKDDYKEKALAYKDKAMVLKDDAVNKIKEKTRK